MGRKRTRTAQKPRNEALCQVRAATGKSQQDFAEAVGMNGSTYQTKEEGRRRLKRSEAELIMFFSGADPASLIEGTAAQAMDGRPYNQKILNQWRNRAVHAEAVELAAMRAGLFAEALVKAAYGSPHGEDSTLGCKPERFRVVLSKLSEFLFETISSYKLSKNFDAELEKKSVTEQTQTMTVQKLKELLNIHEDLGSFVGWDHAAAAKSPPQLLLGVEKSRRPQFAQLTGLGSKDGKAVAGDALLQERLRVRVRLPWSKGKTVQFDALMLHGYRSGLDGAHPFEWVFLPSDALRERLELLAKKQRQREALGAKKRRKRAPTSSAPKAT